MYHFLGGDGPPPKEFENVKVGQTVKEFVNFVKSYERVNDKVDRKCWTKKDKVHLAELEKKMGSIQTRLKNSRPQYMLLLKQMANSTANKVSIVGLVAEAMGKIDLFDTSRKEAEKTLDLLELVVRSMMMVKTILKETQEFWDDQAKFIERKLIPVRYFSFSPCYLRDWTFLSLRALFFKPKN